MEIVILHYDSFRCFATADLIERRVFSLFSTFLHSFLSLSIITALLSCRTLSFRHFSANLDSSFPHLLSLPPHSHSSIGNRFICAFYDSSPFELQGLCPPASLSIHLILHCQMSQIRIFCHFLIFRISNSWLNFLEKKLLILFPI